jgi:hypothetical protein
MLILLMYPFSMCANVLRFGVVADLEALTFNLALNPPFYQTAVSSLWLSFHRLNHFKSSY